MDIGDPEEISSIKEGCLLHLMLFYERSRADRSRGCALFGGIMIRTAQASALNDSSTMPPMHSRKSLDNMKRVDLQRLCKVCIHFVWQALIILNSVKGIRRQSQPKDRGSHRTFAGFTVNSSLCFIM